MEKREKTGGMLEGGVEVVSCSEITFADSFCLCVS